MRYNHFDMLPEKAFQPVGKRMTLEGGGGGGIVGGVGKAVGSAVGGLGGAGKVLGPAIQIGTGSSPLGVFGGALASEIAQGALSGGGGGSNRPGYYAPGQPGSANPYGMGNMYENQQFQGFGGGHNNFGFGMPYAGYPRVGENNNYGYRQNMTPEEYAAHEAAERAARMGTAPAANTNVVSAQPVGTPQVMPTNPAADTNMVAPQGPFGWMNNGGLRALAQRRR